ncbi:MAG: RHS repeat-associated core domain-containing protein, partial [Gammaproteobacteria bacterium]|nr:RHS repeat-associated core domain-containing protein [Gammaproteobacteria bacterium]
FGQTRTIYTAGGVALGSMLPPTEQGFTGHRQLDALGIVHMKGRIYDPTLGRFLQADPFVQAPKNSQNYNRYSYVLNNPMSYTDPSGYFFSKLWEKIKPIIGVIVVAALYAYCQACATYFASSWYGAATAGAIAGGVNAGFNGGNILTGALRGAFAAAAFYGVGEAFSGMDVSMGTSGYYSKVLMHGITGGVMNVLSGGKFGHGFAAAGVTQALAPAIGKIDKGSRFSAGRVAAAAVIGGTASSLSGGKFANGEVTGAFSRLFNDEVHHQSVANRVADEVSKKGRFASKGEADWI